MKFNKILVLTLLLGILAVPTFAFAQVGGLDQVSESTGFGSADLMTIIGRIIQVILSVLGVVFLLLTIYAGVLWMTAGGDTTKIEKAKQTLIRAVIGLLITFASLAIATFIMNALGLNGLFGGGDTDGNGPDIPPFSGSLGNGGILDHYPVRNQIGVPRNARVLVTFRGVVSPEELIENYDDGGTPSDITDDTYNGSPVTEDTIPSVDTDHFLLFPAVEGEGQAFTGDNVGVGFSIIDTPTVQNSTFVFMPPVLDGFIDYTVSLRNIRNVEGDRMLDEGRYDWTFTTSDQLDLTPPRITDARPLPQSDPYARNIAIQITFNEPMDPASASGLYNPGEGFGFDNIQVEANDSGDLVEGVYMISNGYRTVTYLTNDACGVNSCGQEIFCLPASSGIEVTAISPDPADVDEAPTVPATPYPPRGLTDVVGNALDADGDGEVAADEPNYIWDFSTSNEIVLDPPTLVGIQPDVLGGDVALDVPVRLFFGLESAFPDGASRLLASSLIPNSAILFRNTNPTPAHSLPFTLRLESGDDQDIIDIPHGVLRDSTEDALFYYSVLVTEQLKNQYQNCFIPAGGPGASTARCTPSEDETDLIEGEYRPYCCNGVPQATSCQTL